MKYSYKEMPDQMKGTFGDISRSFGFSWKEFVMTIPSPMFLVTTYKSNGKPNACMQSWATFTSADHGKTAHDYAGVLQKKIDVMEY